MTKSANMRASLIPYPVIAAAVGGNPEAVNRVIQHYSGYIAAIRKRSAATQEEHLLSLESTHALFDAIAERDEKKAMYYLEERQKFLMPPV